MSAPKAAAEAARVRALVAAAHSKWAGYQPEGQTAASMRTLLWDVDHPDPADQTPAVYGAWLDEVEPRWPENGEFVHPELVQRLKDTCERLHGTGGGRDE